LLWSGKPDSRRWFYPQDAALVPFSLMWGGFTIFWEAGAISSASATDLLFPLWGVPFVLVGLYMMVGRLFVRRWMRRGTVYALTDQRIVSLVPSWPRGERATSVWLGSYPPIERRLAPDGAGTIWIGAFPRGNRWLAADASWPGGRNASANAIVLADVPDAEEVYSKIRHQLSERRVGAAGG
jgi:hypothetical protein